MGDKTAIAWTDHTFNPWIGCTRVSLECDHCYAATMSERRLGLGWPKWGHGEPRKIMSPAYWQEPLRWNRKAEKIGVAARVFCASLADVFDSEAPPDQQARLWDLIRQTPWLRWQLLTKRPNRIRRVLPADLAPAPNVWLGTSVGQADNLWRIEHLIKVPAVVHFLSVEPLLGPIPHLPLNGIEWVIVGGESGPRFRPMDLAWARDVRDQAVAGGIPFFFKQVGGPRPKSGGHELDGRTWAEFP